MKQHQGIWLPDHEKHMVEWMNKSGELVDGKGTYQIRKLRAALDACTGFRVAIDIGAHVGFWSMHLARRFGVLHAFEPVAEHRECWERNVVAENAVLYPCALGETIGRVSMVVPHGSSGGTHVAAGDQVQLQRLDSFEFADVDFIKIDCEGYELQVLKGAADTLARWRPTVIVEQKPHKIIDFGYTRPEAVEFLQAMGYTIRREISGDYILTWGPQ